MTLYKNVDLEDLKSIMKKGILPISKTGHSGQDSGEVSE